MCFLNKQSGLKYSDAQVTTLCVYSGEALVRVWFRLFTRRGQQHRAGTALSALLSGEHIGNTDCVHLCSFLNNINFYQSSVQTTLEMLLFSLPSPAGDYHYSGKPLNLILVVI